VASVLTREEAVSLVKKNVKKRNIVFHMIAVEAVMLRLARHFGEDENLWGVTGLLHDIDYEKIGDAWEKHGVLAEKALICCDAISGLLVACGLVMPSKKLAEVKVKTVKKKFKDKDFARGADRERILFCEKIDVPKERFFEIALDGLKEYAAEIGL